MIYLARHGEVRGAGGIYYGHTDLELSDRGVAQAEALAARLAAVPIAAVYASDLARCVATARPTAEQHRLEVRALPALREMSLGVLEGLTFEEARAKHPDLAGVPYSAMVDFAMPGGGESLRDVAARVVPAVEEIALRHEGAPVLVVAHHSPNRVYLGRVLGLPLENVFSFAQDFGCLNVVRFLRGEPRVLALNERPARPEGDRIRVEGVTFSGRHGWLPGERDLERTFRADLVVRLALGAAGRSDELGDTLDYRRLAQAVVDVGTGQSYRLLEALAESIAREVLARFATVRAAEATVYKRVPGLAGDPREVSVSRLLTREGG